VTGKTIATSQFITASVLAIAMAAPAYGQDDRDQARTNFLQADANKDHQLDLAEFTTFVDLNADDGLGRASMVRSWGMHETAFGRVDTNGDGLATREEIQGQAER